jgi:hypothetical protein
MMPKDIKETMLPPVLSLSRRKRFSSPPQHQLFHGGITWANLYSTGFHGAGPIYES